MSIATFNIDLPHNIRLSCRSAGQEDRPVLLFLHGFPEAAFAWDEMLLFFSQPQNGGYYCLAPNLRGYEDSSQPTQVELYDPKLITEDLVYLINSVTKGAPLAALIAHDWGGIISWYLASKQPELLEKLIIINSPHPQPFWQHLKDNQAQQIASGYANLFCHPDAEAMLSANDYALLFKSFEGATWMTQALKECYKNVWKKGLTGALNYYRHLPLHPRNIGEPVYLDEVLPKDAFRVRVPTLVLWGIRDKALVPSLIDDLDKWVDNLQIERLDGSHWVIHEQPALIQAKISAFLTQ